MAQIDQSYNMVTSNNAGYNQASALQIRLETKELIENVELFLRGAKLVVEQDEKTGKISTRTISLGLSKANPLGIQAILNYLSCIINPQVVQGNFPSSNTAKSDMYEAYIEEVHIDLITFLVNNCYNWEILDDDLDVICDFVMKLVIPFMTRLIDNLERQSYDATVRHVEHSQLREKDESKFKLLGGNHNG